MTEEVWRTIEEFPNYQVSNLGHIYNNKRDCEMSVSYTNHGHAKISLVSEWSSERFTRSVAVLVAEAFIEKPNLFCDQVILLDGDLRNVQANNLAWRPQHFAWKYTRQLKEDHPRAYSNLPVHNVTFDLKYRSIIDAGMIEGLLFDDIWKSTYTGIPVYPHSSVFEVL